MLSAVPTEVGTKPKREETAVPTEVGTKPKSEGKSSAAGGKHEAEA